MLVACSLVNLTTWDQARPAYEWLRRRYVVPSVLAVACEADLHEAMRPLGLWRRRSSILIRLAQAWVHSPPQTSQEVRSLPGCGKYAADAWAIFMERRSDVDATDGKLLWHLSQTEKRLGGRIQADRDVQS